MPTIPTENDLYAEYKADVEADAETSITDFTPGSVLDVFAGVVATAARGILRWFLRITSRAFVSASEKEDLDTVIMDRVNLPRLAGESDDDYKDRYFAYIEALGRGTLTAWQFFAKYMIVGVDTTDYTISEDLDAGIVTITITPLSTSDEATIKANALAIIDEWRILGGPAVNVETDP